MHLLITGSEGLIGRALTKTLLAYGINVKGLDRRLEKNHPFYGDLLHKETLLAKAQGCDGIIHLGAVSRVIGGEKNPALCWQTNYQGTLNVIEVALTLPKNPWILYASSREVYGDAAYLPVSEDAPLRPMNIYGRSKAAAEKAILDARLRGVQTAIIRYSNVYGDTQDHEDRVIPAFCRGAAEGTPLRIDGSHNTFDFTHISDVAHGTFQLIKKLLQGEKNSPPLHLTTGQETSLRQAALLANAAGGHKSLLKEAPPRTFDVAHFRGDASKTSQFLDWAPRIFIEEGIKNLTHLFSSSKEHFKEVTYDNP